MNEILHGEVGRDVHQAITNIRDQSGNLVYGNVLRRTCQWVAEGACKQLCWLATEFQLGGQDDQYDKAFDKDLLQAIDAKSCSDINLWFALDQLGLEAPEVLMVGVTGNEVGFADHLDQYKECSGNPYGWYELPGFNAFFARARRGELQAIGRRLADCADINFEFQDQNGNTVFGFEHGTRTNMFGSSCYAFEKDGQKMSFTEYVMKQAIEHYGADPRTMHIKLAAAIRGHNFTRNYSSREAMEDNLPGWYDDGFLHNASNPGWRPGDPIKSEDTWEADTRGMIIRDISEAMKKLGVPADNFSSTGIIDPGDSRGVYSSHQFSGQYGDTRDLYITFVK